MSDLIERLRKGTLTQPGNQHPTTDDVDAADILMSEAADEIALLREDLSISLSYRDELVSSNDQLGIALSAAEQRVQEARRIALEEAAKVADEAAEMRERLFKENGGSINANKSVQALIIAANIRALVPSEPQPEKDKNQDDAERRN